MAWVTIANVRGPRGPKGDPGIGAENALQFKLSVPAGNVSTWTGVANSGIYRVPTQTQVDAIAGTPLGAKPGNVLVSPVGSSTSLVTWTEFGDDARTWDRTISTAADQATGWVRRIKTKRVGTSLTLTGGSAAQVRTDFGGRLPVNFGVDIPRWRAHIRNYNLRDGAASTGVLNITGLAIGEAETNAFGQYTGNFIDGTQAFLQGSMTTPSTGSEVITNFFDYPLAKEKAYMLSYAFTGGTGQMVVEAQGGGFVLANGSAALSTVSTPSTISQTMPLMMWIEAEVPEDTLVLGGIGDSLTVGVSSTLPVHDSWLAKLARSKGALPVFWAASGDTLANFASALAWKANQWKAMSQPNIVYFAMGSNDIFGSGVSLAVMKQRFYACWLMLRAFAGPNVVLCSIFPRFNGSSAEEAVRKQYNEWLEDELPGGASFFVDTAAPITNEDGSTVNQKWTAAPTDIHLKSSGYARVASIMSGNAASNIKTSGWRTAEVLNGWAGTADVRRDANTVTLRLKNLSGSASTSTSAVQLPPGYQIRTADFLLPNGAGVMRLGVNASAQCFITQSYVQGSYQIEIRFTTEDAWPV